jgi:hypothetical protein
MSDMTRKPQAAEIAGRLPRKPDAAVILAQALHAPRDEQPEMQWFDRAIEFYQHGQVLQAQREAQRQAEEDAAAAAANAPTSPAGILAAALRGGQSTPPALNSVDILRAALGGSTGTVNGEVIQGRNG